MQCRGVQLSRGKYKTPFTRCTHQAQEGSVYCRVHRAELGRQEAIRACLRPDWEERLAGEVGPKTDSGEQTYRQETPGIPSAREARERLLASRPVPLGRSR